MDIVKRDQFIALWKKYFNDAELPVAFYYSKENNNATIVKKAMGHTCIISYRILWDVAGGSFTWDLVKV